MHNRYHHTIIMFAQMAVEQELERPRYQALTRKTWWSTESSVEVLGPAPTHRILDLLPSLGLVSTSYSRRS